MKPIATILLVTFLAGPAVGYPVTWGHCKFLYSTERSTDGENMTAHPTHGFAYCLGDGVDPVAADRAMAMLPRSVLLTSDAVSVELSPLSAGAYAVCALTKMSPVGGKATLFEISPDKSTQAEPVLTIEGLDEKTGMVYEGYDRLVARVANGILVDLQPGAKANTKILCTVLVWLASSLVCTAMSFWNMVAAIVCSLIHALISMECQ